MSEASFFDYKLFDAK